jgi:hypothetical protein
MSALRPSSLPKLAVCPCFEGRAEGGADARRGILLDRAFRAELSGSEERLALREQLAAGDNAAVAWAVGEVRRLAGPGPLLVREEDCRITMLGLRGTADAIAPEAMVLFDLKSGLRYSCTEQMAAYALGMMEARFTGSWTCHVLHCDQRETETLRFTHEEARRMVTGVIGAVRDPGRQPVPCLYCMWCAKEETCGARRSTATEALASMDPGFDFAAVAADPARLGRFLSACAVLGEFREKAAEAAIATLRSGGGVPGWELVEVPGEESVGAETVGHHIAALGFGPVLAAFGDMPAASFRRLWAERMPGDRPFPGHTVRCAGPTFQLRRTTT